MKIPGITFPFILFQAFCCFRENDAILKVFFWHASNFGLGSQKVDECIKYQPFKKRRNV